MNMEKLNEIEIVANLAKQFPNNQDLGKEYRKTTLSYKKKLDEFCLKYPNDCDLGNFLRKKIKN